MDVDTVPSSSVLDAVKSLTHGNLDKIGQKMPEHGETIKTAAMMIAKRRETYGTPQDSFDRAASIASMILDKPYTAYEVAVIMHAVKLSRISQSPTINDHYVDAIAYLAFASEFVEPMP